MDILNHQKMRFTTVIQLNNHACEFLSTEVNGSTYFVKDGNFYVNSANLVGDRRHGAFDPLFIGPVGNIDLSKISVSDWLDRMREKAGTRGA